MNFANCFFLQSCNFLIFCLILTNFLPKCRTQNVDSEKGHCAEKKAWRGAIVKVATPLYKQTLQKIFIFHNSGKIMFS